MRQTSKRKKLQTILSTKSVHKTSKIIGAEALIRWIDPIKGFIPPNEFIPLAEENDFIIELGEWIIDDALNQYINWQKIGIDISISINISAKQFLQNNF